MEDKARLVAIMTLSDIDEKKSFSNIKLNEYFKENNLNSVDRGFATEIVYGTLRLKLRIDYILQKFLKQDINKLKPWTKNCLRIAVYQILFMDKVPSYAAVNQSVEIVKMKDKRASSFVNAVLRNVLRSKETLLDVNTKDKVKKLSIEFSHPEWFVRKMLKLYDEEFVVELLKINNTPPNMTVRVNQLKTSTEDITKVLEEDGVEVTKGRLNETLHLKNFHSIEKSKPFMDGLFTIQDESSMLCVRCLDPRSGEKVLDLCSAPGGKTTHIAEIMKNQGEIIAFDIYNHKLKLISDNAKRLGIDIIKPMINDATQIKEEYIGYADRVLVDAPCSGLGLMRKKPEIRWNVDDKDIKELSKIQLKILSNASKYVKVGGVMVYSTCTITKEENEEILNKFLSDNPNFNLVSISDYFTEDLFEESMEKGYIKLFPNKSNTDGFFISKLMRTE